jgi:hypothetical protein
MTFVIPIIEPGALPHLVMSERESTETEYPIFTGIGEFQLRDIHVIATVEVHNGIVRRIDFTTGSGGELVGAREIENQLKGHLLSQALEVKAGKEDGLENRHGRDTVEVAALEAFHRAVEAYLDSE